jgi:hypothetical protein
MALEDKRIDQLPENSALKGEYVFAIQNLDNNTTEQVKLSAIIPSGVVQDFEWVTDNDPGYAIDEVVTFQGKWYQSLIADNLNNIPSSSPAQWQLINKSSSGFLPWQAGAFPDENVFVLHSLHNNTQIFKLANATRPYVSSDLLLEYSLGDWELASEMGYVAQEKVAHGFVVDNVITFKAGVWDLYTTGDKVLGIVVATPSDDTFILYLLAKDKIVGAGFTVGQIYYAQVDGTIGTLATTDPLYIAVSTSIAITLAASGTSGAAPYTKEESDARFDGRSTGLLEGAELTINADTTKFDLAAGKIVFSTITGTDGRSTPVVQTASFPAKTAQVVTNLASSIVTWIGLQYLSAVDVTIIQQVTPFTEAQRRTIVEIGVLVHSNLTVINATNNFPNHVNNVHSSFIDLIKALGGTVNMEGNVYNHNGASLNLTKTAGKIFKLGANLSSSYVNPNTLSLASANPVTLRYRLRDSTEYADRTTVDPNNYDLAGVLTAVAVNKWTVQRIAIFQSGLTRVQYGQTLYNTYDDAVRAIFSEEFVTEPNILSNGLMRCYMILKQGATNLQDPLTANFIPASKLGEAAGGGAGGGGGSVPAVVTANITGAVSINLAEGNVFILTLTGNVTSFTFTNEVVGSKYVFVFKKSTTNKTFTWAVGKFASQLGFLPILSDPTINTPTDCTDVIEAICLEAGYLTVGGLSEVKKN